MHHTVLQLQRAQAALTQWLSAGGGSKACPFLGDLILSRLTLTHGLQMALLNLPQIVQHSGMLPFNFSPSFLYLGLNLQHSLKAPPAFSGSLLTYSYVGVCPNTVIAHLIPSSDQLLRGPGQTQIYIFFLFQDIQKSILLGTILFTFEKLFISNKKLLCNNRLHVMYPNTLSLKT